MHSVICVNLLLHILIGIVELSTLEFMCQTTLISNSISRLSTRSYKQRMDVITPDLYRVSQLARLNRDLEQFYDMLYDQWRTVTEDDYNSFGRQLCLMLETIKGLCRELKKITKDKRFAEETERLKMNYSSLYELNSDIVNFAIKLPQNARFNEVISEASRILNA